MGRPFACAPRPSAPCCVDGGGRGLTLVEFVGMLACGTRLAGADAPAEGAHAAIAREKRSSL